MARQLWLLRHAEAEPHGSREDSSRRLTERGEQQARAAGAAIARMEVRFDAILYSPKVRAAQTAELAAEAWDEDERGRMESYQPLAGGLEAGEALDVLAGTGTRRTRAAGRPRARPLAPRRRPDRRSRWT